MSDQGGAFHRRPSDSFSIAEDQRWGGVLSQEQVTRFREKGLPLAFDPVQIGWVPLDHMAEDAAQTPSPLSWSGGLRAGMVPAPRPDMAGLLRLRAWDLSDVATYRALLDDAQVWRFMHEAWPGAVTEDLARGLIEISTAADHHEVRAVLCDGQPVGQVRLAFAAQGRDRSEAEISYWLGRAHWGRGIGGAAVTMATRAAFEAHRGLRRIVALVHPDNRASARLLRAAGYALSGHRGDGWLIFETTR
ncbi:MAG: GNAT family N-acetyltransferase [Rhodobacterales bacterium]|nr:GNAT family N-acetyltransferase [Rhodobacterales bacterium]MDX5389214.1 GNAT family N-acetyltransferase [Rhodobacterales bacterium]MDX5488911.1 GNAT family N-acetyltransferase [Rhodobacterales bacterium]